MLRFPAGRAPWPAGTRPGHPKPAVLKPLPECPCASRVPDEPAGQRSDHLPISRLNAAGRLQLSHCSTAPSEPGAAQLLAPPEPQGCDLAKHRAT
jgi:hypothetical protein